MVWILTEFIGMNEDGEELYVKVEKETLFKRERAEALNQAFRFSHSNLRYYEMDDLPAQMITEEEALPYRKDI